MKKIFSRSPNDFFGQPIKLWGEINVLKIVFNEVRGQQTNFQTVETKSIEKIKTTQLTVFANAFDSSHT